MNCTIAKFTDISDSCTFYKKKRKTKKTSETTSHLFFSCDISQKFLVILNLTVFVQLILYAH